MQDQRWPARRGRLVSLGGAMLLALGVAACGGDDGGGTSGGGGAQAAADSGKGVTEACSIAETATQPVSFKPPGEAVPATAIKGKTIAWVTAVGVSTTGQVVEKGVREAAAAVGAEVTRFDARGNPTAFTTGIEQALDRGASAIVTQSINPQLVKGALAKVKDKGVPLIMTLTSSPIERLPDGVAGEATVDYRQLGRLRAAKAVCDTKGKLKAHMVTSTLAPSGKEMTEALEGEIARLCPDDCSLKIDDVPVPDFATKTPALTASAVQREPGLNYTFPVVGLLATFVVPKLTELGVSDKVAVSAANLDAHNRPALKSGAIDSDAFGSARWMGYLAVDQAIRRLSGKPAVPGGVPIRMVTTEMAKTGKFDTDEAIFGGSYVDSFREMWGVPAT